MEHVVGRDAVRAFRYVRDIARDLLDVERIGDVNDAKPVGKPGAKPIAKPVKVDLAEAYEKVAWEIQAAIKAGKITPEQGKEKLAAFKKQLGAKVPAKDGVKKPTAAGSDLLKLFQLVEKGELTAEEAIKKYKAARVKKEIPAKKELPGKK